MQDDDVGLRVNIPDEDSIVFDAQKDDDDTESVNFFLLISTFFCIFNVNCF